MELCTNGWVGCWVLSISLKIKHFLKSLQNSDEDKEIRPEITCAKLIASKESLLGTQRFQRFSCWNRLVNAVSYLKQFLVTRTKLAEKDYLQTTEEAERLIIKEVQTEAFLDEMECIKLNKGLSKERKTTNLDPFIDDHGLLRVGRKVHNARLPADERHPVIIPGKDYKSLLLVRHFNKQTKHQGRHFTSGAVRCRLLDNRRKATRVISTPKMRCMLQITGK